MFIFTSVKNFFVIILRFFFNTHQTILTFFKSIFTIILQFSVINSTPSGSTVNWITSCLNHTKNFSPLNAKFVYNSTNLPQTLGYSSSLTLLPTKLLTYVYTNLSVEAIQSILVRFVGVGFFYLSYSCFIMYIDACLTDDEPLWEPIE